MNWENIVAIVLAFVLLIATFKVYFAFYPNRQFNWVRFVARVGIFGAMASILYVVPIFTVKLPFFPAFLSIHLDEIPAFIAGFAYGPVAGLGVILVKTLVKLPFSFADTMGVGELCDLILSSIYVGVAALIYKKKRNLQGVAIAFGVSTAIQIVAAMVVNVYMMVPLYMKVLGLTSGDLLYVMRLAIPSIENVEWSYALLAVAPFNALKDAIVVAVTFVVYRSIHKFLRFESTQKALNE